MDTYDVAVVGLGAMGSAALWRLAQRGARVIGIEQFEPGHDRGSSHGESRIIRSAYFEDPRYVPLVLHAFTLWRELEEQSGTQLLTMTGALMIGPANGTLITGTLASVRAHGLAHEMLDANAMQRRFPQHHLAPHDVAIYEDMAGVLRPESAVVAMIQRAERLGAEVRRQTRVTGLETAGDRIRITTDRDEIHARHAIVSVGPWLPGFFPNVKYPLQVERQVLAWFPVRDPDLYSPARCPVYLHELPGPHHRYGFPTLDGATVKIAVHHEGRTTSPDTVDRTVHPDDLAPIEDFVRGYLDGVEPTAIRSTVCLYTNTPDEHFIVGMPSGWPNVTVLGGFSGHGFKFAPVIGDAAADVALQQKTDYPIELFSPQRFEDTVEAAKS